WRGACRGAARGSGRSSAARAPRSHRADREACTRASVLLGARREPIGPVIVVARTCKRRSPVRDSENLPISARPLVIAKLGMTGNAGAPHTHFEIRPSGRAAPAVNPCPTLVKDL